MKAAIIHKFGTYEEFKIVKDFQIPVPGDHQVLIRVIAAGINPLDIRIRKGQLRFFTGAKFPMVLGNDVSGVIEKCGSRVKSFKIGDRVFGMIDTNETYSCTGFAKSGAYGEYCITREDTIALLPKGITFEEGASIPLSSLTAYQALIEKAKIKEDDEILINGASGGVGIFAVQIAKSIGARVTAVCSEKNAEFVKLLGADQIIDYKKTRIDHLEEQFDVIYDVVATSSFFKCRKRLKEDGRFVSNIASLQVLWEIALCRAMNFFRYSKRSTFVWVKPSKEKLTRLSEMIRRDKIKPYVEKIYTIDEIAEAHKQVENNRTKGKVVLKL